MSMSFSKSFVTLTILSLLSLVLFAGTVSSQPANAMPESLTESSTIRLDDSLNLGPNGHNSISLAGVGEQTKVLAGVAAQRVDDMCGESITSDGTASGEWAEGCDSTQRSGSYARFYSFTLAAESEVTITLELTSGEADTYLYLREGNARSGDFLHENDDDGSTARSQITATLEAGSYTIEATTYDAGETGGFTITSSGIGEGPTTPAPEPSDSCVQDLSGDGTTSGEWAEGCDSTQRSGSYARFYTFTLAAESEVTITLTRTSGEADTYLYLRQGSAQSGEFLYENDDHDGTGESQITETLEAGSYTIEATTYDAGETGGFTVTISGIGEAPTTPSPEPSDSCVQDLTSDGTTSGEWAEGCDSQVSGRGYARYYTFTLAAESEVTITLTRTSGEADTYLYLRQGSAQSGEFLYENDDHGGTGESQITATLDAGSYTIEATTYDAGQTGSFTVTISGIGEAPTTPSPEPSDSCVQDLTSDGTTSGEWAEGCDSQVSGRGYARYYTFTLAAESEVTITLTRTSGEADTYLYLRQGSAQSGEFLYENDDHGGTGESQITATLDAGSYTIEATTYDAGQTGSFTLALTTGPVTDPGPAPPEIPGAEPVDDCPEDIGSVSGAVSRSGSWAEGCYARQYTFDTSAFMRISARLESADADTFLYLLRGDADGEVIVSNDSVASESGNASSVTFLLPAGTYTAEATTFSGKETGNFDLTVTVSSPPALGNCATDGGVTDPEDNSGLVADCNALLEARDHLSGDEVLNWSSTTPIRQWHGISMLGSPSRVTSVNLSGVRLNGSIPAELGRLTALRTLRLSGSYSSSARLRGKIPAELGNLSNLTELDLSNNHLAGEIPPELGQLTNLTGLRLNGTRLNGSIPAELGNLTKLRDLHINNSRVSGQIPSEFGKLTALSHLELSDTRITGPIPPELGNMTSLRYLEIRNAHLNGAMPAELGQMVNLNQLDLSRNLLSGEIPEELGNLTNLWGLRLWDNRLSGSIPASLGNLERLSTLDLGNNRLTGVIPEELTNLNNLFGLWLSNNRLTGSIPEGLGNLRSLEYLGLASNRLTGDIPASLGNLTNLSWISLAWNELTGCVPNSLRDVPDNDFFRLDLPFCEAVVELDCATGGAVPRPELRPLLVQDCNLLLAMAEKGVRAGYYDNWSPTTSIYQWWGVTVGQDVERVTGLRLQTDFYWRQPDRDVPEELGQLTGLESLEITGYSNGFNGPIPASFGNLVNLEVLNLGGHVISGPLPVELGNLSSLRHLDLGDNRISGQIPASFGLLAALEELQLQSNMLSGSIPAALAALANVEEMRLSGNALSGCIPDGLQAVENNDFEWLPFGFCSDTDYVPKTTDDCFYATHFSRPPGPFLGLVNDCAALLAAKDALDPAGELNWTPALPVNEWRNVTVGPTGFGSSYRVTSLNFDGGEDTKMALHSELGRLGELGALYLQGALVEGEIPLSLGRLNNLWTLGVYGNELSGTVPHTLGRLSGLRTIDLSEYYVYQLGVSFVDRRTRLGGPLPVELGRMANLESLTISSHQIGGPLPEELGNLENLESMYLGYNNLSGPIPLEIGDLVNLTLLYLDDNNLSGPIPPEIGDLVNLRNLWLNDNNLSGDIPGELGNLERLRAYYLYNNNLTGCVPATLADGPRTYWPPGERLPFCEQDGVGGQPGETDHFQPPDRRPAARRAG